jgi:ABC-type branched-subunit amino acid transport system substrate-binding protein
VLGTACAGQAPPGPTPVRIGSLISAAGLGLNDYQAAFRAAERSINAHGGIRGRPVVVEVCDDRNDPNLAQACARQLVAHGVVATAGDVSELTMVEGPILNEAGIPRVGNFPLNPEDSTLPNAFPLEGGLFTQMAGDLVGLRRRGLHTLFVVTVDTPPARTQFQLATTLLRAADVTVSGVAYLPAAATDFTPYVRAAMQSHADVVFPLLPRTMALPYLVTGVRMGARPVYMMPFGVFQPSDLARLGGDRAALENDVEFSATPPLSAGDRFPAIRAFQADMDAELAAGDRAAAPGLRSVGAMGSWLAVQIIARLAATLPTVDAPGLTRALRTRATVDTLGMTPPWTPGQTGPPPFTRVTNLSGYLLTRREGQSVLVEPEPFNPFALLRAAG